MDGGTALPPFSGLRILAGDDDAARREGLLAGLAGLGVRAEGAAGGLEALAAARTGGHHMILLRAAMAPLTGYDIAVLLRQQADAAPPLVALDETGGGGRWREAGMDACLEGPADAAALGGLLAEFFLPAGRLAGLPLPAGLPLVDRHAVFLLCRELDGVPVLVEKFGQSLAPGLDDILAAGRAADADALAKAAHRLKGPAQTLGLPALSAACKGLEERGRRGDLSDTAALREALPWLAAESLARLRRTVSLA